MRERLLDVRDDRCRHTLLPARVIQRFGVVAHVFVEQQARHGRRPEERAEGHLRSATSQRSHYLLRISRCGREARVLEAVNSGSQPAQYFLGAVRMCDHRLAGLVRFIHQRQKLRVSHLILVDDLDDVDTCTRQGPDLRARVFLAVDAPTKGFGIGVRPVLQKRPTHVKRRSGNSAGLDRIARVDARLQRPTQVARARDARHEELLRGSRHDDPLGIRRDVASQWA